MKFQGVVFVCLLFVFVTLCLGLSTEHKASNACPLKPNKRKFNFLEEAKSRVESLTFSSSWIAKKLRSDARKEPWTRHHKTGITKNKLFTYYDSNSYGGNLLSMISMMTKAEKILELGMFTGVSAAIFLDSPFVKNVVSVEREQYLADFVSSRLVLPEGENVKHRIMVENSTEALKKLARAGKKFNLIFLDISPEYPKKYVAEYEYIMGQGLLESNGVMIIRETRRRDWEELKSFSSRSTSSKSGMNNYYNSIEFHVKKDERVDQFFIIDPTKIERQLTGFLIVFPRVHRYPIKKARNLK